ncbi:MAG: hypothetical protein ACEQSF_04260 [Solirubrobacteraceae bacterium]
MKKLLLIIVSFILFNTLYSQNIIIKERIAIPIKIYKNRGASLNDSGEDGYGILSMKK